MTISRYRQICLDQTPYYHCVSRCVRRAHLCGWDRFSGKSYEHRRGWVEALLLTLPEAFCIDVVGYAVMSNHYHVILMVNADSASLLTPYEVIDRWAQLYTVGPLISRYRAGEFLSEENRVWVDAEIKRWRDCLMNLSRFMGYLNEKIARQANKEDGCAGRFWEGRFKSQALLDDTALLQCMAYVDLNPVRAGIAKTPEVSEYTSLKHRLDHKTNDLVPFQSPGAENSDLTDSLPVCLSDYLDLLDWTGRIIRDDRNGSILESYPPILDRLDTSHQQWIWAMGPQKSWMQRALGSTTRIKAYCHAIGQQWLWQKSDIRTAT